MSTMHRGRKGQSIDEAPGAEGTEHFLFALTIIDCPGHCHFHDGTLASLRVSNGATLFVNAVDGLAMRSDMELRQILAEV